MINNTHFCYSYFLLSELLQRLNKQIRRILHLHRKTWNSCYCCTLKKHVALYHIYKMYKLSYELLCTNWRKRVFNIKNILRVMMKNNANRSHFALPCHSIPNLLDAIFKTSVSRKPSRTGSATHASHEEMS